MNKKLSRAKFSAKYAYSTGGVLGGVSAIFSDFLFPLGPFGLWISGVGLLVLLVSLVIYKVKPENKEVGEDDIWFAPFASAVSVVMILTYGMYNLSTGTSEDDNSGIVGRYVPGVKELQMQLGVLKEMNANITEIADNTRETANNTKEIVENTREQVVEQKNTSKNTEQISKATYLSLNNLRDALIKGDLATLEEFDKSGVSLTQVNMPINSFAEPMILEAVRINKISIDKVLDYLSEKSAIQLDSYYSINPSMSMKLASIWQKYPAKNTEVIAFKKENKSFDELKEHMESEYNYIVPDSFRKPYVDAKSPFEASPGWISGPGEAKTTLYVEAFLYENKVALNYLKEKGMDKKIGFIHMLSGVKVILDPVRM